ncbi:IPT/TIG domain-containing protein [Streptomyces sp. NPDC006430]|uniref:IPT/TIG domain-containing protein n=1 Tax=Streptomyces sp. NPDC006430 TaxID=3154299 RepID=UPI0033B45D3E
MVAVISSLSPSQGPSAGGNTVTINGTGFTGTTAVKFGAAFAPFTVTSSIKITATAPAGTGSVAVTVSSPSGTSNNALYTYSAAPVVSGVSPNQGPAAGGNTVTISGTGFTGTTAVKFGATSAPFTVNTATQITATAPPGTGSVTVTVSSPSGTSNNTVTYTYTTAPAPVINNLSPNQGPTSGGNTVTINGTGFTGITSVKFGTASVPFTVVNTTQITAVAPAAPAAPVNVTVSTPTTISNAVSYFYIAAPTVTGVDPTMGPVAGGNTVTITGTNLILATAAAFGTGHATNINVLSDSQITADAPSGNGTVTVTVTTPGGTSLPGQGDPYYTYLGTPGITSLIPDNGPAFGGTSVSITGTNLTYTDEVRFDGTTTSFAAVSDNLLVATAPAGTVGTVSVTVHTPGGNSNGLPYRYEA